MAYLSNPFCNSEFKKKIKDMEDNIESAKSSADFGATMASMSMMKNFL